MSLKGKIAGLAVAGVLGAQVLASAASVGVVFTNPVMESYAGIGAINMQLEKLQKEYEPKEIEFAKAMNKMKTDEERQAYYAKHIVPALEAFDKKHEEILRPASKAYFEATMAVAKQKGLDVIVRDPMGPDFIVPTSQDTVIHNITGEVIDIVKTAK